MKQQQEPDGMPRPTRAGASPSRRTHVTPAGAGRMSRQRAAEAARRRLITALGAGTVIIVVAIIAAALVFNHSATSLKAGMTDPNALNPASTTLAVGSTAPNFDLATVDGTRYSLAAERGHPVLLEFFAVWCPICQGEAPILHQIDASFASKGLRTLAVLANPYGKNYDASGRTDLRLADRGDIAWFEQTFKVTHPTLIDPTFSTVNQYGANSYPTLYVLDRHGVIRYATYGHVDYAQLAAEITAAQRVP